MNILIIAVAILGALVGFHQGALKQIASMFGIIIGLVAAVLLYNQFGNFLADLTGTDPGISLFEDRVNSVRSSTSFHFLSQKNMCFFPSPNVSVHVAAVQQEAVLHAYILRTMWSISPWGLKKPRQQQTWKQMVLIQPDKNVNRKISLLTYFLVISNN